MSDHIENIVIVGGGTSGWMSACYLQRVLGHGTGRKVKITVVESDDVGIIGVGEATIPSIRKMMLILGVPEHRLFTEADATYKNALKLVDWVDTPKDGKHSHYYHAFDPPFSVDGFDANTHWAALKAAGRPVPTIDAAVSVQSALCDHHRAPQLLHAAPYESSLPYAYHLDAVKLGRLLRTIAMERGVERIIDHVTSVKQHEGGDIAALETRDGRTISGDFFIDCTGFAALLIEKTLKEPFVDFTDRLLCDRAVACQIPLTDAPPRPYTTCTAKSAGWMWEIDLTSRRGTGYVYSSKFISDEDAEAELLAHINPDGQYKDLTPRRLQMRIGRRRRSWVNNCVAIGLSGGFLEPLESTGIHLIELGVQILVDYLGEGEARAPLRDYYNNILADVYEEIADFIQLHYIFNKRYGEPFWDAYRKPVLSENLQEQLKVWAHRMPSRNDFRARVNVFDGYNLCAVIGGLQALPAQATMAPYIDLEHSEALLANIARLREEAIKIFPSHADILKKYRMA